MDPDHRRNTWSQITLTVQIFWVIRFASPDMSSDRPKITYGAEERRLDVRTLTNMAKHAFCDGHSSTFQGLEGTTVREWVVICRSCVKITQSVGPSLLTERLEALSDIQLVAQHQGIIASFETWRIVSEGLMGVTCGNRLTYIHWS